jgi:hypothetical protein
MADLTDDICLRDHPSRNAVRGADSDNLGVSIAQELRRIDKFCAIDDPDELLLSNGRTLSLLLARLPLGAALKLRFRNLNAMRTLSYRWSRAPIRTPLGLKAAPQILG